MIDRKCLLYWRIQPTMPLMNLGVVANWSLLASTAKIKWAIFMWTKRIKTYQIKKKNALASASLCLIPSITRVGQLGFMAGWGTSLGQTSGVIWSSRSQRALPEGSQALRPLAKSETKRSSKFSMLKMKNKPKTHFACETHRERIYDRICFHWLCIICPLKDFIRIKWLKQDSWQLWYQPNHHWEFLELKGCIFWILSPESLRVLVWST